MARNQNNQNNQDKTKPEDKKPEAAAEQKQPGDNAPPAGAANPSGGDQGPTGAQQPNEAPTPAEPAVQATGVLLLGGWELSFRFADLLTDAGVDVTIVDSALQAAKDAGELPAALMDVVIPHVSLQRYAAEIAVAGYDPELVSFVVADPAVDPTLRSLNFMRRMQGLGMTHFYPRFHEVIEAEADPAE